MESLSQCLALAALVLALPANASDTASPMRSVTAHMNSIPLKFSVAAAPVHPLPKATGASSLRQVPTGGTQINTDGIAHGAGAAGVSGAVGEQQYVQLAGGRIAVYRKDDGVLLFGPVGTQTLFANAGLDACARPHAGAGSVVYDQRSQRWIVAQLVRSAGQAIQCIAVSTTADAVGPYRRHALPLRGAGNEALQAEDARMALWSDALYFSFSLFDNAQGTYRGPRICRVDLAALVQGRHATLTCADLGRNFGPVIVAAAEGNTALSKETPALIMALDFTNAGHGSRLLLWRWPRGGAAVDGPLAIPVAPFVIACAGAPGAACIDQPFPGARLSASGDRLMPRVAFRHNALLAAHAVQLEDGQTGMRWYELRDVHGAAHVYQQGTHAPDKTHRASGSIGIDKAGNIALGYSVAGIDTPPGVRYAGRQRSDPPGRMAGEEVIVNGNGVQADAEPLGAASGSLSLDPLDDCTFWYTQQYLPMTGPTSWRTRIASFKFRNCG